MITRDDALRYFDSKKQTFGGMQAGDYIDKYDFEKLVELLPSQPPPTVQGDGFNDKTIGKTVRDLPEDYSWEEFFEIAKGIPQGTKNMFIAYFELPVLRGRQQPSPNPTVLIDALKEVQHHFDTWADEPERAVRISSKVITRALQSYPLSTTESQQKLNP